MTMDVEQKLIKCWKSIGGGIQRLGLQGHVNPNFMKTNQQDQDGNVQRGDGPDFKKRRVA